MEFFQEPFPSLQPHKKFELVSNQSSKKSCCKKTLWSVFALGLLGLLLSLCSHGLAFYRYTQLPTCREKIDFMIKNKILFLSIMKTQACIRSIASHITTLQKRNKQAYFGEWLERRFIMHLENDQIQTVQDLPWADRSIIRILDSSQKLSKYVQRLIENLLYALTFYYPSS